MKDEYVLEDLSIDRLLQLFTNPVIDTKALFTHLHPDVEGIVSTDFLIGYYGIDASDLKRHDALDDCILIGRIFRNILEEYMQRGVHEFTIANKLRVKRFRIPAMYNGDANEALEAT